MKFLGMVTGGLDSGDKNFMFYICVVYYVCTVHLHAKKKRYFPVNCSMFSGISNNTIFFISTV